MENQEKIIQELSERLSKIEKERKDEKKKAQKDEIKKLNELNDKIKSLESQIKFLEWERDYLYKITSQTNNVLSVPLQEIIEFNRRT